MLGRITTILLAAIPVLAGVVSENAAAIMAQAAANVERAAEARSQYVYRETVRSSMVRFSGEVARKEYREYTVTPGPQKTAKKLANFNGEYRQGKEMVAYSDPKFRYKGLDLDGELIQNLTEELVNDEHGRDGIPPDLFPLCSKHLSYYVFRLKGESEWKGRRLYQIEFEPNREAKCDDDCPGPWKGEAWIDAGDLQPVRITTDLAFKIPWAVRTFLGTDLKQTGFSITYERVDDGIWFPATYGTEFRLKALFGYKRTVTLSLQSDGFRKADVTSKVQYSP